MSDKLIITFLFTDIEQSTRLVQRLRESYPILLEQHRVAVRNAITKFNGYEVDIAGDGFFIVFENPDDAVQVAMMIQASHTEEWATSQALKVRIGLHTGEALATNSGYTGVQVHCASRICDAAHGGQTLISEESRVLLSKEVLEKFDTVLLGDYIFKDFNYPCLLYQLMDRGQNLVFPELRIYQVANRVAVLPFLNTGGEGDVSHFGMGLAEELISSLGRTPGLRVIARNSTFAINTKNLDVQQIGRKLNATSVLQGEVQVENSHIKISVSLNDTISGNEIWSETYYIPREEIFQTEDEITKNVTRALEGIALSEQSNSIWERQTKSIEAYDFYLRGRRFYLQFSTEGMKNALRMFEKAVAEDPAYGLAYAGIADANSFLFQHLSRTANYLEKADTASQKAVELSPILAEGHVSRGIVLAVQHNFQESEKEFQTAIEIDPSHFLGWFQYARACFSRGKLDKAARLFHQASKVEPEDYQSVLLAAQVYDDLGERELAHSFRQRGVETAFKYLELDPGDTRALYFAANALVFLSEPEKSAALIHRALALEPHDSMLLYNAGCVYALMSMETEALNCLERAYIEGFNVKSWYENDSNLDRLREHPRFVALLEKMS